MTPPEASTQAPDSAQNAEKHERFMALLTPCLAPLSRYCHAMTKDDRSAGERSFAEDPRDLLSDAIVLAYENFEKLRAPEAFLSYIFTTARRLYYRRARRNAIWERIGPATRELADERSATPELRLDLDALDRALNRLPEKQREAVVLFEISELSLKEIREIQGGSLSGVKSRIVRGRERLAELLGEQGEQPKTAVRQQAGTPAPRGTSFQRNGAIALIKEKI